MLVGMMEACFDRDAVFDRNLPHLVAWLEVALREGMDPKRLYAEALANMGNPPEAPRYKEIAPIPRR